jgi:hypothetical protein
VCFDEHWDARLIYFEATVVDEAKGKLGEDAGDGDYADDLVGGVE